MFTLSGKHSKEKLVPRELGVCNSARLVSDMRSFRKGRGPTVNRTDLSATDNVSLLLGIKKTSMLRLNFNSTLFSNIRDTNCVCT